MVDVRAAQKTQKSAELQKQLSKTRTTDLTEAHRTEPAKKETAIPKRTAREKQSGGDEGGNTIISIVKAVIYIVFVFVISVFLALAIITVGNDVFAFVKSDEVVEVTIPEYATLDDVAGILYQNDIIKYPKIFKMYAVFRHDDQEYLAGQYAVNGMMNYDTLLAEFKEKPVAGTIRITIPEGYTIDEIIDLFVSHGMGTREGFIDVLENGEFDYWFTRALEENGVPEGRTYRLEGYLFPDTYEFYLNSSETTIINKMLKRFGQIFTKEYRQQCEVLGYSVDQIVTLASMIEKEAGSPSQFFLVSSVFHNRLNYPYDFPKLDSDATIVYAIQCETGERVALTGQDLYRDTPYNTYQNDGLPPGPIANPSASALLAALSPTPSDYFFFVSNAGVTYFSKTKAEHQKKIAEFGNATTVQTTGDVPTVNP